MFLPTTPEYECKNDRDVDADADASISSIGSGSTDRPIPTTTMEPESFVVSNWKRCTDAVHKAIDYFIISLSLLAARNPKRTIVIVTFVSFALVITGFLTNFVVKVDYEEVYAPIGSKPIKDKEWIDNDSGFPETPRPLSIILHDNGNNVLGRDQVDLLFEALDTVRSTEGYDEICQASTYRKPDGQPDCKIFGATRFWSHDVDTFHQEIDSNESAIQALSAPTFEGGVPVFSEFLFGYAVYEEGETKDEGASGELLTSAKSFFLRVDLPNTDGVEDFELEVLERLSTLQEKWATSPGNKLQLSYFTFISYDIEFTRAINTDLILVPFVVLIMSVFTCLVFYKSDRVQSRSLLGLGSVAAVGLSLMSGFGLMFVVGIPFTSMTQLLPFVVFGVGLDDTYIVTFEYLRSDPDKDTLVRIEETMKEVGQSIALTTITTMSAFILGCISTIPAIQWVCIYAFPTIFINFVYQITLFVAFLVLDERRVKAKQKDCCICASVETGANDAVASGMECIEHDDPENTSDDTSNDDTKHPVIAIRTKSLNERFMSWYAEQLMKKWVKTFVFVIFIAYFVFCAYCTTNLSQRFRTQDFVPADSYVADFLDSLDSYSEQVMGINVYFRGVNQSDAAVQSEMIAYMQDLVEMPAVNGTKPPFCWVMDFQELRESEDFSFFADLSFNQQVDFALSQPAIKEAYGDDIVQDKDGNIVASRCWLNPKYLDLNDVSEQIDLLADQRAVSLAQPVNSGGLNNMKFFTFDALYFLWEFYTVAVEELIFTTLSGIVAVCLVGFVLIEHRSATAFVFPMILILYVDLLGTLQLAGLYINAVTYVCLVISIGLLVDFLMHVILRYYESECTTREEKVKETLETMGASILVGGLSTFLGVIPLAFSTSVILRTVFTAFFAMVTLGLTHGLILLPVVLSLLGPTACTRHHGAGNATAEQAVAIADMKFAKNFTGTTTRQLGAGSRTSDSQSVSSSSSNASISHAASLADRTEILRIMTDNNQVICLECTDIVEC